MTSHPDNAEADALFQTPALDRNPESPGMRSVIDSPEQSEQVVGINSSVLTETLGASSSLASPVLRWVDEEKRKGRSTQA